MAVTIIGRTGHGGNSKKGSTKYKGWASSEEVLELMREFDPNLPAGGQDQFFAASNFSGTFGITYMFNTTYSMSEGSVGRTSIKDSKLRKRCLNKQKSSND